MLKGIESKFWRLITALLLTILTIMLMQGLFDYFSAPKVPTIGTPSLPKSSFGGFFKNFGMNFKPTLSNPLSNLNLGLKTTATAEKVITETTTPTDSTTPPVGAAAAGEEKKTNKWWWLLLLLLPLLIALMILKPWMRRGTGTTTTTTTSTTPKERLRSYNTEDYR